MNSNDKKLNNQEKMGQKYNIPEKKPWESSYKNHSDENDRTNGDEGGRGT